MRIDRIELTNFRNYETFALDFAEPRTLLVGPNGAGKSTCIDAIAWVLTGRCRGVDAKGGGQKDLIRNGADATEVNIYLEDIGAISRSITRAGGASSSLKTEAILGKLKTTEGMLQAVLYGSTFFDLHHSDAKALLMQALGVTIPKSQLPGVTLPKGIDKIDLGYLDSLFDTAYQNRATVKRNLLNHRLPDKPRVADMASAGKSVEDLQLLLADHQDTLQNLVRDASQAERKLTDLEANITQTADLAASVEKLKGTKAAHDGMLEEHQGNLAKSNAALVAAQALPAEPVDSLAVQVRETEVLVEKIGRHDPERGCILSATIPCLTKGAEFTGQIDLLRATVKRLGERIAAGNERQAAITAANQSIRDAARNVTYHETQIEQASRQLAEAETAGAELKTLRANLPARKKAAKEASEAVPAQRSIVDAMIAQVQALAAYKTAQAAYERAAKERTDLEAAVKDAEALVKLLGPDGVRVQVLGEAMAGFEGAINEALEGFGFAVTISPDPWQVLVTKAGTTGAIRFDMLSKGQRLWTGLAFQLALAKVSGLDLCVIDDVESIVGEHRNIVTGTVLASDVGQVLVSMAKAENESVPDIVGLQVERLAPEAMPVGA